MYLAIPFTQFLRPHGRQMATWIERPEPVALKATHILQAGFRFECEVLTTGLISLTISDAEADYACEVVTNTEEVPAAVDRLILEFDPATARSDPEGECAQEGSHGRNIEP
jgi:hypothetical protein